jgi:pyruvate dehydrogenase E2 component (dihydrolipoamide acetyltransferase)
MPTEVVMPKLGLNMSEGMIVEWLKQEGDPIQIGEPLFVVETDKITIESEAQAAGILAKILVPAGESVAVTAPVAIIVAEGKEQADEHAPAPSPQEKPQQAAPPAQAAPSPAAAQPPASDKVLASPAAKWLAWNKQLALSDIPATGWGGQVVVRADVERFLEEQGQAQPAPSKVLASPLAKRIAQEQGIDLATVTGTGSGGRISREDVERALAVRQTPAAPEVTGQGIPIEGVRAVIAERMHLSVQQSAQVTLQTQADATALVAYREHLKSEAASTGQPVPGYNAILVALVAKALREHPYMNARQDGNEIVYLDHVHVGTAVDTERGLLVVVVPDADQKTDVAVEAELSAMAHRALEGNSLPDDLSGGTFTITNLGAFGVDHFTPILNPPEIGILGVGRIVKVPAFYDGQVVGRHMMGLSLTFDHRLVDGAPAARFLRRIDELLQVPYVAAQPAHSS